jgi:hypothetical protein
MQQHTTDVRRPLATMVGFITALLSGMAGAQAPQPTATPPAAARPAAVPPAPAAGGAGTAEPAPDGAQGPQVKVERGAGGKKIYRITDAIRIEGKIQKPEAFYVLQKSSINYDWLDLKQDFIPKILDSVSRAPF